VDVDVESGKWKVESGKWRGSGSHIIGVDSTWLHCDVDNALVHGALTPA